MFPALPASPGDRRRPAARSRRWALAAAAAATAVTAAACGAPGSSAPAAQPSAGAAGQTIATTAPKGPVTLNFYIESGFPLPEKLAAEFQKQYPNVKIKLREDQFAVLTQNAPRVMASNDAPDLIRLPTIVSSAKDGLLANLDGYAKAYGWDTYPAGLLNQMRVNQGVRGSGPLYAMGIGYDVTGVFYNKALAAKIGMTRPPQTVAEMESDLAKAKAKGIQPIVQFNDIGGINFPYQALLNQYEDPSKIADWVFDKPGANIDTPAAVKAADQIAAWGKAGYFTKDANALSYTDMMSRFGKGQGLFMFNGDWESQNLQKTMGKNVGFFLAPPATAGGRLVAMSAPDTYAIPAKSKNIAATAFFLNWVHTNPKARQLVVDVTGASPGGPSSLPIPPVPAGSVVAQTLEATKELGDKGVAVDFTANATAGIYANTIKPELQKLITGRETGAGRRRRRAWVGLLFTLPALVPYALFVLRPLVTSVQYSLYDWNGIGVARFIGLANYRTVLTSSDELTPLLHAFELIGFFTVIPVVLGLVTAALLHGLPDGPLARTARVVLFIPQVIPLVAAALAWSWVYSSDGVFNQLLHAVGLGGFSRAWLGDFTWAFPAVGVIGAWVLLGLCTLLLMTGINKIDPTLYDAARIDGTGPVQEFFAVTLPGLRREIGVCVTVTVIAALASFDIVYVTTQGGPGNQTMVPGLQIFQLAFTQQDVGLASANAIVLMALVLLVVTPLQRISKGAE